MSAERSTYLGPRLRRLRRDLGLTQPDLASALEISSSYVSLIESNQRPLTAELLLRLARTYRIDLSEFAGDGGEAFTRRLQDALKNPLFADLDLPRLQSADVATNYPSITEAFLRLHTAYGAEQRALAERRSDVGIDPDDPVAEVRRLLLTRRNHFPIIEDAGQALAVAVDEAGGFEALIKARHRLRVRRLPPEAMMGQIRRHDPHHRSIFLDDSLDIATERFQLAVQLAYLSLHRELDEVEQNIGIAGVNVRRLMRRTLANYAAGAILMPYSPFARMAEERRYDVEALARCFNVSWETAAHRLSTLGRPAQEGVPFSFIRIDAAGNVSKHYDGAGFPVATQGGGCPLWSVHHALRTPGQMIAQWLELPDGQRFLSVARTVTTGGGGHGLPRIERVVALVCTANQASRLIYADPPHEPTPIGITCVLCQRDRCPSRALPPISRQILPDDYHRGRPPLGYADA
ncbi:short-chain fatty acyl-CoA regulator family protein [Sphingomonas sp.]|uniref:helix-turn-helix domain-containing protein n=1 Tax=Sphingomonas sp. TaxID=28214 RepID=UPI0035B40D84